MSHGAGDERSGCGRADSEIRDVKSMPIHKPSATSNLKRFSYTHTKLTVISQATIFCSRTKRLKNTSHRGGRALLWTRSRTSVAEAQDGTGRQVRTKAPAE